MLRATKEVAKGKIDAIVAKEESSQFFLIGNTPQLAVYRLDELTITWERRFLSRTDA